MNQDEHAGYARLDGRETTVIIAVSVTARLIYWGAKLPQVDPGLIERLCARAETPNSPASEAPIGLTPLAAEGFAGRPGIGVHRNGADWAPYPRVVRVDRAPGSIIITSEDPAHGIAVTHDVRLAPDQDVLIATTSLKNMGTEPLTVDHLSTPVVPLPHALTSLISFEGRWAGEFQTARHDRSAGTWLRENRRGRTSHDAFPACIATAPTTDETRGDATGFHLGWSGNHRIQVETLADGRGYVACEPLLLSGEIILASGATFTTPALYTGFSNAGLSGLSQAFHRHLRARPEHARIATVPRPVHYNSWEAVYFDHDPDVLTDLIERAADIGVERFVLDDGWFTGRRNDRTGLGDWQVDPAVYPHGLKPLIENVQARGMQFGLWVEPEMVNPNSALFRAHPEWVFAIDGPPVISFRHQQVLDFGRADVRDHIVAVVDALLRENAIDYLKWDMNRDISQPGTLQGHAGVHAHVEGVYAVLAALRALHPCVEIESCASGGGRADYGILAGTDRIWTSDSNDALDRLAIQRGFSMFFPAELMGSHVGPATCHITRRVLPMSLRVATAMFGHMGVECDLRAVSDADLQTLAVGIAVHKRHRLLIHTGDKVRIDVPGGVDAFMIATADRSEALVAYTCITEQRATMPDMLIIPLLDPKIHYVVEAIWPQPCLPNWAVFDEPGLVASGALLMTVGLQPPRMLPGDAFVLHLKRQAAQT